MNAVILKYGRRVKSLKYQSSSLGLYFAEITKNFRTGFIILLLVLPDNEIDNHIQNKKILNKHINPRGLHTLPNNFAFSTILCAYHFFYYFFMIEYQQMTRFHEILQNLNGSFLQQRVVDLLILFSFFSS